jgi:hypothetical protein
MDYQWGADIAVMRSYMDVNSGYGFFLLVIDFFSRYVWTKPLQSAKGSEMVDALRSILAMGRNPMTLGYLIQNINPTVCLMVRHVSTQFKFQSFDCTFGLHTCLFVL